MPSPRTAPRPPRRRRAAAGACAALGALGAAALPAGAAVDDLVSASRATGPSGAEVAGTAPAISADGDVVAFASAAPELIGGGPRQVFVRRIGAAQTVLVSRADGPDGAAGSGASLAPSLSAGGRHVAFTSSASNLVPDDRNGAPDVFVRDLESGLTTLVSRAVGGGSADGASTRPSISAAGRYVAFTSTARNLLPGAITPRGPAQVYVHDTRTGTTTLVSRASGAGGARGDGRSGDPAISADGLVVAFASSARNLAGPADAPPGILVRDLRRATTERASRASGADGAAIRGSAPAISGDGRFVAFVGALPRPPGTGPVPQREVFVRALGPGTTDIASRGDGREGARSFLASSEPAISADGRFVAFRSLADLSGESAGGGVYVRDLIDGRTALASRAAASRAAAAGEPAISADGRFVAFVDGAVLRRDVLGPKEGRGPLAPGPLCAPVAPPAAAPAPGGGEIRLTRAQLLINQRIAQAAIRRLNAVQARLDAGLAAGDICGYAIGPADLAAPIDTRTAGSSLALADPAEPAPIVAAPRPPGAGGAVRLTAEQLLVNQRIGQAAVRRANALAERLNGGLTGGDIQDGAIDQRKLISLLRVTRAAPSPAPAASRTVIPPRRPGAGPARVRLSVGQLRVNQRVFVAAVRRANALVRRLEAGITGAQIRDGSLTAADLAPGVAPPAS